jgi:hydrogenase nickel incorporation protein HypA/HybF
MHETSIAVSILETVVDLCRRDGYAAIESVRIRVGQGANILPEALSFAFDMAKQGTLAAEAVLLIEVVPLAARCDDCGCQMTMENRFSLDCPSCGGSSLRLIGGYDMEIIDMDVA